jgi:hypothetical protein
MARTALVARIAGALAVLAGAAGCDGEVIHLGNGPCPHAQVPASQVVWIGDSWVKVPGNQITGVEQAAQTAGAIASGDTYTDASANGALMAQIAAQYTNLKAMGIQAKVLIMDGGTLDTIMDNSSATVTKVEQTFTQLLAMIAADGTVTDIIYYLMPDIPTIMGVPALRMVLEPDCAASTVRCHFLDLTDLWSGHSDYTNTVGGVSFPSEAGATVIANQIWAIMQASCIAQ